MRADEPNHPRRLVVRRTRVIGIALAMDFHLAPGAGSVGSSATPFALLSLFVPVSLVYERGGVTHRLEHAETDPELSSLGLLARKLLLLRTVPDTDRGYFPW